MRLMRTTPTSNVVITLCSIVVFALAVALRVPSCYESFWVDELHSAWCVWDSFTEVLPRVRLGHQSPFYFVGLWCWKQVLGESEVALRLSSVIAVAAASVVMVIGVTRWTHSIAAGVAAGLVIAIEEHSLFFGTELRPYAFVILFASVTIVCFLRLIALSSRHDDRLAWFGFVAAILMATACQPTALGVLAWFPIVLMVRWLVCSPRSLGKLTVSDGLLATIVVAVGWSLWTSTLSESWSHRGAWASFASATNVRQIWEIWDWTWLLLMPLAVVLIAAMASRAMSGRLGVSWRTTVLLSLILVVGTFSIWGVAWAEWLPVWHRRYLVASMPIFAAVVGGAVGSMMSWRSARIVIATLLVAGLAYQQGNVIRLRPHPVALVARGEDWRSAMRWASTHALEHDRIYLDSGLIEARDWLGPQAAMTPPTGAQLNYLVFPALGPYRIDREVQPIGPDLLPLDAFGEKWHASRAAASASGRSIIVTRRPASRIDLNSIFPTRNGFPVIKQGFGGVSVIVFPLLH